MANFSIGSIGADAGALAATSATLGIVGGITTPLAFLGLGSYGLVEGSQRVRDFTDTLKPELQQFGIADGSYPAIRRRIRRRQARPNGYRDSAGRRRALADAAQDPGSSGRAIRARR